MKKYKWNICLILGIGLIVMGYCLKHTGLSNIWDQIKELNLKWIALGGVCMVSYWVFESIVQHLLVRKTYGRQPFWNAFKVTMVGQFFNAVTPSATGGQPMQMFLMSKQGIPPGLSGSILLIKFILYQVILTLYCIATLTFQIQFFYTAVKGFIVIALGGFVVNLMVVLLLVSVIFFNKGIKKVGFRLVNLLEKLHIIKDPLSTKRKIIRQVDLFHQSVRALKNERKLIVKLAGLTLMQLSGYFIIPYTIYKAFDLSGTSVLCMLAATTFIIMVSSFIPVPGSAGVAEGSFYLFFALFFPTGILPTALLLWRIITFYIPLCLGGAITALPNSRKTFTDIQLPG